jgi:hypothetical protein
MVELFKPTQAVKNNSLRGVALFEKAKSLASQTARDKVKPFTEQISKGALSLDEVKQLYSFLTKAEQKYQPNKRLEGNNVDSDTAAFLAAGGSSALAWTRLVLKEQGIVKSYKKEITQAELDNENELQGLKLPVTKAVNEELQQATFIVMAPDEVDLHGDITSEDEVRKACHNFNKFCQKANLFHLVQTDTFEFVESYIAPTDFVLGDKFVKKGTWLCTVQCLNDGLWELIKSGDINGVSIGAMASVENLEKDDE